MIDQTSRAIDKAAVMLGEKEREFLDASVAVEAALANGQTGLPELDKLTEIAAEFAKIADCLSDHIQTKLASFIE